MPSSPARRPSLRKLLALAALICAALVLSAPVEARTLRWARAGDAASLDPHAASDPATRGLVRQIYEALLTRNPKGELVGELATAWRQIPSDASTWEFKVRPG